MRPALTEPTTFRLFVGDRERVRRLAERRRVPEAIELRRLVSAALDRAERDRGNDFDRPAAARGAALS